MLDEAEFSRVAAVYQRAMESIKRVREEGGLALGETSMQELLRPVCEAYTALTGFRETHANAVMHHRISMYGPPCPNCGKPFRTPTASFCTECGCRSLEPR